MKTKTEGSNKIKAVDTPPVQPQVLSEAWVPFSQRLSSILQNLEEDQFIILTKKHSKEFIQIVCQGSFGTRLETISNFFRDEANQLTEAQIANLIQLGWYFPTGDQVFGTPEFIPDGSPNFYYDAPIPIDFAALAGMAVKTFTDVLHISHPGFLEYQAFDQDGNSLPLPTLGLKLSIQSEESDQNSKLSKMLLDTVKELTAIDDLSYDADGNICGIYYGSINACARLIDDLPYIRLFSGLLDNIETTHELLVRLNELNAENGHMHLIVRDGFVIALSDILIRPFIASHIAHGLENFCQISDEMHITLQAEFGDGASVVEQPTKLKH